MSNLNSEHVEALRAGTDKVLITPKALENLSAWGGSFKAVHDPLHMRTLVISDAANTCALVTLDMVEVGDTGELRARIAEQVGIPSTQIMIVPSHSHNAPMLGSAPAGSMTATVSPEAADYSAGVCEQMLSSIRRALGNSRPAWFGSGRGSVDVNVNRDEYVDGAWTLGHNPEGPSDKTLSAALLRDAAGNTIAILVNYAVHPTVTLGTHEISADLVGEALAHVEAELGGGAVAFWLPGAIGDQAPRVQLGGSPFADTVSDAERDHAYRSARIEGLLIGAEALRVAASVASDPGSPTVVGLQRVIACPIRRHDELPPGMSQADVETVDLTLSLIRIGSVALLGASGEVTTPLMQMVRNASPLTATLVVSNANSRIGYLPEDEAFDRMTFAARGSSIARGYAQQAILEAGVDMIYSALRERTLTAIEGNE